MRGRGTAESRGGGEVVELMALSGVEGWLYNFTIILALLNDTGPVHSKA